MLMLYKERQVLRLQGEDDRVGKQGSQNRTELQVYSFLAVDCEENLTQEENDWERNTRNYGKLCEMEVTKRSNWYKQCHLPLPLQNNVSLQFKFFH